MLCSTEMTHSRGGETTQKPSTGLVSNCSQRRPFLLTSPSKQGFPGSKPPRSAPWTMGIGCMGHTAGEQQHLQDCDLPEPTLHRILSIQNSLRKATEAGGGDSFIRERSSLPSFLASKEVNFEMSFLCQKEEAAVFSDHGRSEARDWP